MVAWYPWAGIAYIGAASLGVTWQGGADGNEEMRKQTQQDWGGWWFPLPCMVPAGLPEAKHIKPVFL